MIPKHPFALQANGNVLLEAGCFPIASFCGRGACTTFTNRRDMLLYSRADRTVETTIPERITEGGLMGV